MAARKQTPAEATAQGEATIITGIIPEAEWIETINLTEAAQRKQHFTILDRIDVTPWIEKKKTGNTELTYLSWAHAFRQLKLIYPDATYHIKKFGEKQLPYVYDPLTGYMVFTDMTIEGITHEMWLPVMDGANRAMKDHPYEYTVGRGQYQNTKSVAAADMFDINKTIMRCLVKNIAMFGLGIYIYAGEDLPFDPDAEAEAALEAAKKAAGAKAAKQEEDSLVGIKRKITDLLVNKTTGMSNEEKAALAREQIFPIVGTMNHTLCGDLSKLTELHEKLSA